MPLADLVRPEAADAAQTGAAGGGVFRHGVASGDPRADRVILWTRVSGATGEVPVRWTLAANPQFTRVVARGETPTGAARDFTVKVDVTGLAPATTYYYRFDALGGRSPVGRTRTLPGARRGARANRAGLVRELSARALQRLRRGSPSAPTSTSCCTSATTSTSTNRADTPTPRSRAAPSIRRTRSGALDDYRRRYALYRTDPDLQEAHRQHPFVAVWDDHEIANNTWSTGAENHQPEDGDFFARRDAAYQAFLEWLPMRDTGSARQPLIYRSFALGDLADLVMLDTRLAGRDRQVERTDVLGIEDPRRTILGAAQEHWLDGELRESVRAPARAGSCSGSR